MFWIYVNSFKYIIYRIPKECIRRNMVQSLYFDDASTILPVASQLINEIKIKNKNISLLFFSRIKQERSHIVKITAPMWNTFVSSCRRNNKKMKKKKATTTTQTHRNRQQIRICEKRMLTEMLYHWSVQFPSTCVRWTELLNRHLCTMVPFAFHLTCKYIWPYIAM